MQKTFAIIDHAEPYETFYHALVAHLKSRFSDIQSGLQGDAWIMITEAGQNVHVNTFDAMQFEIKADDMSDLLQQVITAVQSHYPVRCYEPPLDLG